ncbi:MAG: hypothetical protein EZS28_013020 [Streblomastix strix]|uniref:Uncharacterized protein n=1 Tax=Streblomastix strix TaxID=222440 RepID=A0A5J4W963_9EUKA|nr:MAG: hypothetical protein EZS28_013020 [Streblomastix strix]
MRSRQKIQNTAILIIQFIDSYTQNNQGQQNEQLESESQHSLTDIASSLQSFKDQIRNPKSCKFVIRIPKLLQSLVALSLYKINTRICQILDQQRFGVRSWSRWCLSQIRVYGDEQVQSELVNNGFGRVMSISFCTAGGVGEEEDEEINDGLYRISRFLRQLHEGSNYWQPSLQPLPLLARRTEEQIEEEGANEEIEAQMNNKGMNGCIKGDATWAKEVTLNNFINQRRI